MSEAVDLDYATAGEPFSVGRTFSRSASVFSQGFGKFFLLTGIVYIPTLVIDLIVVADPSARTVAAGLASLTGLVVAPISAATSLFGAFQIMRQRSFTLGEAFSVAFSRFWPVLGVSLLGGLFIGLLMLLLLVPGLIYSVMIFVAQPACVLEPIGPLRALRRSRELTKGYRWPIFGLYIAILVAVALGSIGAGFVGKALLGPVVGALVKFVGSSVLVGFSSVLSAVAYSELRADKEGVDVDQLARVFD